MRFTVDPPRRVEQTEGPLVDAIDQWTPSSHPLETTAQPAALTMRRLDGWRFARPPRPEDQPGHPDFTRVVTGSLFQASDQLIDHLLDVSAAYRDSLDAKDVIGHGEFDIAKKITVQVGRHQSAYKVRLHPEDPPALPGAWVDILRGVVRAYAKVVGPGFQELPDQPVDTNAGWPTFGKGPIARTVGLVLRDGIERWGLSDMGAAMAQALGHLEASAWAHGLSFRQGPRNKKEDEWLAVDPLTWESRFQAQGMWPRARAVYMASAGINQALRPLAAVMQAARKRLPGLWHAGSADATVAVTGYSRRFIPHESDISGFDTNVSRALQVHLADALTGAFPGLSEVIAIWSAAEALPVASGHPLMPTDSCLLTATNGGTHSGLLITAEVGTILALTTLLFVLGDVGGVKDPVGAWLRGDVPLLVAGDDVLIWLERPISEDDWASSWDKVNLPCSLIKGVRFLMKHRVGSEAYMVGARVLQQTFFNEHIYRVGDVEALETFALQARLSAGVHPSVRRALLRALLSSPLAAISGLSLTADCQVKADGALSTRIERAILNLATTSDWERAVREAEYRPSAALIVAYAAKRFPQLGAMVRAGDASKRAVVAECYTQAKRALSTTGLQDYSRRLADLVRVSERGETFSPQSIALLLETLGVQP